MVVAVGLRQGYFIHKHISSHSKLNVHRYTHTVTVYKPEKIDNVLLLNVDTVVTDLRSTGSLFWRTGPK